MRSISGYLSCATAIAFGAILQPISVPAANHSTADGQDYVQAVQLLNLASTDVPKGGQASAKQKEAFFRELTQAAQLLEKASDSASKEVDALEARGKRDSALWSVTAELALTCAFARDSIGLAAAKGRQGDWKSAAELVKEQARNLRDAKLTLLREAKKVGV